MCEFSTKEKIHLFRSRALFSCIKCPLNDAIFHFVVRFLKFGSWKSEEEGDAKGGGSGSTSGEGRCLGC